MPATADDLDTALSFTTDFLNIDTRGEEGRTPREALFSSGLGMLFRNDLLQLSFDYKAHGQISESSDEAAVFQQLGASLRSSALNQLLGVDANIEAGSTLREGGDAYVHSIRPGISKSLADLGKVSVQYFHLLDKAGVEALEKEKQGFRMGLEGSTFECGFNRSTQHTG